jgi:hypothetical protein
MATNIVTWDVNGISTMSSGITFDQNNKRMIVPGNLSAPTLVIANYPRRYHAGAGDLNRWTWAVSQDAYFGTSPYPYGGFVALRYPIHKSCPGMGFSSSTYYWLHPINNIYPSPTTNLYTSYKSDTSAWVSTKRQFSIDLESGKIWWAITDFAFQMVNIIGDPKNDLNEDIYYNDIKRFWIYPALIVMNTSGVTRYVTAYFDKSEAMSDLTSERIYDWGYEQDAFGVYRAEGHAVSTSRASLFSRDSGYVCWDFSGRMYPGDNQNIPYNGSSDRELYFNPTTNVIPATLSRSTGKYYFEIKAINGYATAPWGVGVVRKTSYEANRMWSPGYLLDGLGWGLYQLVADSNFRKFNTGTGTLTNTTKVSVTNTVIGIAVDLDAGKLWFSKNNVWIDSGNPGAGTGQMYSGVTGDVIPYISFYDYGGNSVQFQGQFSKYNTTYSPPSGFLRWEEPWDPTAGAISGSTATGTECSVDPVILTGRSISSGDIQVVHGGTGNSDGESIFIGEGTGPVVEEGPCVALGRTVIVAAITKVLLPKKSLYLCNRILNLVLKNNYSSFGSQSPVCALFKGDPFGNGIEASFTNYARQSVTFGVPYKGKAYNINTILFTSSYAKQVPPFIFTHWALMSAGGTVLYGGMFADDIYMYTSYNVPNNQYKYHIVIPPGMLYIEEE